MANQNLELALRISADMQAVRQELAALRGGLLETGKAAQQTATDAATMTRSVDSSAASMSRLAKSMAGIVSVRALIGAADEWGQMSSRIRIATDSTQEYEEVQRRLMDISDITYKSFSANAELFVGTAATMRELGYETSTTLDVTAALSAGLVVSGADAQRTATIIDNFSKALSRGTLRGDEFRAVLNTPRLAQALQDGLGKTRQELLAMAEAGKLTTDTWVPALLNQLPTLTAEAERMPVSVSDAMTRLNNHFTRWVGQANDGVGATRVLTGGMTLLADNIDTVASAVLALAVMYAGRYALATGLAIGLDIKKALAARQAALAELEEARAAQVAAAAELKRAQALAVTTGALARVTTAENAYAAAQTRTAAASKLALGAGTRLLGLLGGPLGIALTLAATGYAIWSANADEATESTKKLNEETEKAERPRESAAMRQVNAELRETQALMDDIKAKRRELYSNATTRGSGTLTAKELETARALKEELTRLGDAYKRLEEKRTELSRPQRGTEDGADYLAKLREELALLDKTTALQKAKYAIDSGKLEVSRLQKRDIEALAAELDKERELKRVREEAARAQEQKKRSDTEYVAGLIQKAAQLGMTAEAIRDAEISQRKLSITDEASARTAAKKIDVYERQQRILAGLAELESSSLKATGKEADAAALEAEQRWKKLKNDLEATGNTEGLIRLKVVIEREKALSDFNRLKDQLSAHSEERTTRRETAKLDFDAGRISRGQFKQITDDIDAELIPKIQQVASEARTAAQALGDPVAVANVDKLAASVSSVDASWTKFLPTLEQGAEMAADGLTGAIMDFVDGTKSASEAFKAFAAGFLRDIAQMILKQMIFNAIKAATGFSDGGLVGYATGGYTGGGGKYTPAGVVHRGEYVMPQERVREPGALSFLSAFHREGMDALARFRGYAEGGLVGTSPVTLNNNIEQMGSSMSVNQRVLPVVDPDLISDALRGPKGEELLLVHVSRNPAKFRQAMG